MMKKLLMTAVVILLLLIAVTVVCRYLGSQLPEEHQIVQMAQFRVPPDSVWSALTDYTAYPLWRRGVSAVELMPLREGLPVWREYDNRGQKMSFQVSAMDPPRQLVIEIIDQDTPYTGSWEFFIEPIDQGCAITITERGRIHHNIMRFVMHKVIGLDKTVKAYVRDLEQRFTPPAAQ